MASDFDGTLKPEGLVGALITGQAFKSHKGGKWQKRKKRNLSTYGGIYGDLRKGQYHQQDMFYRYFLDTWTRTVRIAVLHKKPSAEKPE